MLLKFGIGRARHVDGQLDARRVAKHRPWVASVGVRTAAGDWRRSRAQPSRRAHQARTRVPWPSVSSRPTYVRRRRPVRVVCPSGPAKPAAPATAGRQGARRCRARRRRLADLGLRGGWLRGRHAAVDQSDDSPAGSLLCDMPQAIDDQKRTGAYLVNAVHDETMGQHPQ